NKITVFEGTAKLTGAGKLAVAMNDKSRQALSCKNVILATGARARQLPDIESDGKLIWTYREAMVPPEFPKSLLVIGSGAIGIEFASFYRTMGAEVTVCMVADPVPTAQDAEDSAFATRACERQGMESRSGATVSKRTKGPNRI